MTNPFFEHPILNSPYDYPLRHWELDSDGQPTQRILESQRKAETKRKGLTMALMSSAPTPPRPPLQSAPHSILVP